MRQKSAERLQEGLGRAIRLLRTERGLNRKELAERAALSYPYLSEVEAGKKQPSSRVLAEVAAALEVGPEELLRMAAGLLERLNEQEAAGAAAAAPIRRSYFRSERAMAAAPPMAPPALEPDDLLDELLEAARELPVEDRALLLRLARRLRSV